MNKLLPFSVLKITFKICFQVILAGGLGEESPRAAGIDQTHSSTPVGSCKSNSEYRQEGT